jgi:hypothetical protein
MLAGNQKNCLKSNTSSLLMPLSKSFTQKKEFFVSFFVGEKKTFILNEVKKLKLFCS